MGHAFVTGGSGGIGGAVVEALRCRGWRVTAPTHAECDVTSPDDVTRAMGDSQLDEGLDAVIDCAGLRNASGDDVVNVNLLGAMNVGSEAVLRLKADGRLVLISSVSAITPAIGPGRAAYAASKAGVRALGASLRKEHRRLHVTTMILGATDTPIWGAADTYPREKMLRPADVADAIVWVLERPPGVSVDELTLVPQSAVVRPPGW